MADKPTTDDLTPKHYKAISALLSEPTICKAATLAGCGERTLYAWLTDPTFAAAYRTAQREAVSHAIVQLQKHAETAAKELGDLVRGIGGVKVEVRLSAARTILEMAIKSVELGDVQDRIGRLEEAYAKKP